GGTVESPGEGRTPRRAAEARPAGVRYLILETEQIVQRFAPADQLGAAVRHEHGRRTRHAVVVRRHREGVGPRGRNCEQVVASRLRPLDAVYEHVSGFAVLARNAIGPG